MLSLGFPGAVWLLLAVPPLVLFYFLRLRFRRQKVSSIYLWSRLKQPTEGSSRVQRRSILLLLLQLLIVIMAWSALARPAWFFKRPGRPGMMVLMDVSASMAAMDGGKTRWDHAVDWIDKHIQRLPADQEIIVILCAAEAKPLEYKRGLERNTLVKRLRAIQPLGVRFDERNVRRHLQAWITAEGRSWETWLITDGGLDMGGQELLELLGGALHIQYVGADIRDMGLYGLRIAAGGTAEFSVQNSWPTPRRIMVRLTRNDQILAQEALTVQSGISRQTLEWPDESVEDGLYQIKIVNFKDGFSYDDNAFFAVNPLRNARVLFVGPTDPFLKAVLHMPGIEVMELPEWPSAEVSTKSWDLIISNGRRIPQEIDTNILFFGELPTDAPIKAGNSIRGRLTASQSNHPLMRFVDWENANISKGQSFQSTDGVLSLATVDGQPVLVTWETKGWTRVVFGFSLTDSDLGLSGAFPIFLQNLLHQCLPQFNNPYANTVVTGSPIIQTVSDDWKIGNKQGVRFKRMGNRVRIEALSPGGYRWRDGRHSGVLAANLPVIELDLAVRPITAYRKRDYRLTVETPRLLPLAEWLIGLLVVCIALEWVVWRGWKPGWTRGDKHGIH